MNLVPVMRAKWIDWGILAILIGWIALSRLHTCNEPVDWDVSTYAVIGHGLNEGKSLYTGVWDAKPPAVYVAFAAAERIAGYGMGEIYLLGVIVACVTTIAVYCAAADAGRGPALMAATAFALISGDMRLDANRPNTEPFINACLAIGFALLVRLGPRDGLKIVALGAVFALASFFKQVALAPVVLLLAAHVLAPPGGVVRRRALVQGLIVMAIIAAGWAGMFGYFAATGRGRLFWLTTAVYPLFYGGGNGSSLLHNVLISLEPSKFVPPFVITLLPCALATIPALIWSPLRRRMLLIAWIIGAQVAIALPHQFFNHYYQYWLTPLALGCGWGIGALFDRAPRAAWAASAAVLGGLVAIQLPTYFDSSMQWAEVNYGSLLTNLQPLARELATMVPPGQTFYMWGDEAWLYFQARRDPPVPGFWRSHLTEGGPVAPILTDLSLARLKKNPPPIVVVWPSNDPEITANPIAHWIDENYVPLNDGMRHFPLELMKRKEQPTL